MKSVRWLIRIVASVVLVLCLAWLWLLHTTTGARFVLARVQSMIDLQVATVDGSIARGLDLQGVRYMDDSSEVSIETLSAAADVSLLPMSVDVIDARVQTLRVTIQGEGSDDDDGNVAATLEALVLPFPLHFEGFQARDIQIARDDWLQSIDALELSASWFEDIRIRGLALSTAELDAEGEIELELRDGNALSSDLHATLKPALTRAQAPLSITLQASGNLAGVDVLAAVGTFATIDGRVDWQDGLDVEADVVLEKFEPSEFVDDWPAGFPIDGELHAMVDETGFAIEDSVLEIGAIDGRIRVDAGLQRATGEVDGRLQWQGLRWPLPETETRVRSDTADLRVGGTLDDWTAAGTIAIVAADLPRGVFRIDAQGNRDGARGRIVDSEVFGGRVAGEVAYTWRDPQPWLAKLDLTSVELAWLLPDWPLVISGRLDSEGAVRPFSMRAVLQEVSGDLRGEALRADGVVTVENGDVVVRNLRIEHGGSTALLDGALLASTGLSFDASITELSLYTEALAGPLAATGRISLADERSFFDATLNSASISVDDITFTELSASVEGSDNGQSAELSGVYRDTPIRLSLGGAFADWREPLTSRFEGELRLFEIDFGDEHSMALSGAAPVTFAAGEFSVESFCIADLTGGNLCADVNWRKKGDYGAELVLQDMHLGVIEHVTDSPLLFEQNVSGTFRWQQQFGAGPRGSGRLTLSPGTVALVEDPASKIETGDAVFDFEIEEGRLLRGDIRLPLPGRGEVAGDFAVADVRLGADSDVEGSLLIDFSTIRVLSKLTPLIDNASGALRARVALDGTVAEPVVSGEFKLDNGSFAYRPVGLELTEVNLAATMDPDYRFDLSGTFRAGRGKAEIVSRADYSNVDDPGLRFQLRGDRLTVVNVPDVFVEADADIDVALDGETLTIEGAVAVPNAMIRPRNLATGKINESEDVVIVAGELPDEVEEPKRGGDLNYRGELNVSLGESVVVDLDVAKANITGAVNFDWQGEPMPIANGRYLIAGNIAVFGQVLDIAEGSVRFPKVPADQPYIRVAAERDIYGNTQVKHAGVLIDGPIRRPTIEAYTLPATTEERALALLVTGSDFDYEEGVGAVDFGTYIAPRLFVSYGIGVFERENIISARFDLTRGFGIKASSGSKESGIDLNYRFEN